MSFIHLIRPVVMLGIAALAPLTAAVNTPDTAEVVWDTPGKDSQDSMPLGNGDIGLNVWTEASGDVVFYLSKTDAWAEAQNSKLVKLGRVRVSLTPNPFAGAADYRHSLDPRTGVVTVSGGGAKLALWVDANAPVVRGEISAAQPVALAVSLDPWRVEPNEKITADVVVPEETNQIVWYHRNAEQKVQAPLAGRTFGAALFGAGLNRQALRELRSTTPTVSHRFQVVAYTQASGPLADWRQKLDALASAARSANRDAAYAAHVAWWSAFWDRSYIRVSGDAAAAGVTQGYALQRFITAAAGRGAYPIKFNGSIFVTDHPTNTRREKGSQVDLPDPFNADERAWGGQYWFQNTRPMYWPRLAAGDYDLMLPLFRMYRDMLPLNSSRVRELYGHGGAYFRETAPFWGDLNKIMPEDKGGFTAHYYLPILELSAMMLDYYEHTQDEAFAREMLLPVVTAGITFYDEHFTRGTDGRLLLDPVNSIEMFLKVRNPTPDLAAFYFLLPRLLKLPANLVETPERARWQRLLSELPPLPMGEKNGVKVILPYEGEQTVKGGNTEVPELYSVYPFRLYGAGKPELALARDTFAQRSIKRTKCWHQDPVWAAYLGLAADAKKDVTTNLTNRDPRLRFPAFWQAGHDYAPDQDNGGNGELALQRMLLQPEGQKILLLPAWPAEWDVDFKLHAPLNTTVSGRVAGGRLVALDVTPASRRADLEISAPYSLP